MIDIVLARPYIQERDFANVVLLTSRSEIYAERESFAQQHRIVAAVCAR